MNKVVLDSKDITDDNNNAAEMERVYKDLFTKDFCKTDIIDKVTWVNDENKFIFDMLPLTNSQKEELLLHVLKEKEKEDDTGSDTEISINEDNPLGNL